MARRRMSRRRRRRQIIMRCVLIALLAIGALAITGVMVFGGRVKIDLNEKSHAILTGNNGGGRLEAQIDVIDEYKDFFDTVRVEFSNDSGLSNGDKVTVTYSYDEEMAKKLKLKVVADEEYVNVDGLPDTTRLSIDQLFEGVDIQYSGIAPLCQANLIVEGNQFDKLITYQIVSDQEYYDLGDVVSVRAIFDEDKLFDEGYTPELPTLECIKDFQVAGVDAYLTSADEVTDEILASLQKEAISLFADANEYGMRIFCDAGLMPVYENRQCTFEWRSPKFLSAYFYVVSNDEVASKGLHINDIKLCYEAYITQADGKSCGCEAIVRYENLYIRADGTVELNLDSGEIISADRRDKNIKRVLEMGDDDDYMSTKLTN